MERFEKCKEKKTLQLHYEAIVRKGWIAKRQKYELMYSKRNERVAAKGQRNTENTFK